MQPDQGRHGVSGRGCMHNMEARYDLRMRCSGGQGGSRQGSIQQALAKSAFAPAAFGGPSLSPALVATRRLAGAEELAGALDEVNYSVQTRCFQETNFLLVVAPVHDGCAQVPEGLALNDPACDELLGGDALGPAVRRLRLPHPQHVAQRQGPALHCLGPQLLREVRKQRAARRVLAARTDLAVVKNELQPTPFGDPLWAVAGTRRRLVAELSRHRRN
mmetsp:Transcript_83129/g.269114  ORF Transcript_83129/g.269114 Transcript_83129/m.269114 type:complete len:218 (+) Transcript_83129:384-1037(+)